MRYPFIHDHKDHWPVRALCRSLCVVPSGYYAWRRRHRDKPPDRQVRRLQLIESIRDIHDRSDRTYGSPRMHRQLRKEGIRCSRKTVEKLMKQQQIRSKRTRRFRPPKTTDSAHGHPIAPNTLDRQFHRSRPAGNRVWVADITHVPTQEGWLYLAVVMDLDSRKIVGWATADHLRAQLPLTALQQALKSRRPRLGTLLHHSDRGSQYACADYRQVLKRHGIACSMSRAGNCYDNAAMESFFATVKTELIHHRDFTTRKEANASIYPFIELFYNRQRLHSALGYTSPVEYEATLP
jgi:transposase InsO family protein